VKYKNGAAKHARSVTLNSGFFSLMRFPKTRPITENLACEKLVGFLKIVEREKNSTHCIHAKNLHKP
jgi:hypothetical protein